MSEAHIANHKEFELGLDENCARCMSMKVHEMYDSFFRINVGFTREEFDRWTAEHPQFRDVMLNATAYRIKIEREATERRATESESKRAARIAADDVQRAAERASKLKVL